MLTVDSLAQLISLTLFILNCCVVFYSSLNINININININLKKVPEWQMMWGAKVKTPVDMPDDILKDAIEFTTSTLSGNENFENNGMYYE